MWCVNVRQSRPHMCVCVRVTTSMTKTLTRAHDDVSDGIIPPIWRRLRFAAAAVARHFDERTEIKRMLFGLISKTVYARTRTC